MTCPQRAPKFRVGELSGKAKTLQREPIVRTKVPTQQNSHLERRDVQVILSNVAREDQLFKKKKPMNIIKCSIFEMERSAT